MKGKRFSPAIFPIALALSIVFSQGVPASPPSKGDRKDSASRACAGPAKDGLDEKGNLRVSPEDRCPVCAMRPADHPKFSSAIELKDGRTYYFCGTGCMIRSWLHPEVFLGVDKEDLARPIVRDYFKGEPLDGRAAYWVVGSDVLGPMGRALVPLRSEEELRVFIRRHGGKESIKLQQLDDEGWEALTGKKAAP